MKLLISTNTDPKALEFPFIRANMYYYNILRNGVHSYTFLSADCAELRLHNLSRRRLSRSSGPVTAHCSTISSPQLRHLVLH